MKIVDKFLNKHHLFKKPHKWFIAVLVSPIHAAEMHYKKKYHMKFGHARKLFIFDMCLIALIFILGGFAAYWHLYDPTVVENINLKISQHTHEQAADTNRIKSGEHIEYEISYQNNSKKILKNAKITVELPEYFDILQTNPTSTFNKNNNTFTLPELSPGSSGSMSIEGFYFGKPKEHEQVVARLHYNQNNRNESEDRLARAITILQGSYVETDIKMSDKILAKGESNIEIAATNNGHHTIKDIHIPLPQKKAWQIQATNTPKGSIDKYTWHIPKLSPNEKLLLSAKLVSNLDENIKDTKIAISPKLKINNKKVQQATREKTISVLSPKVNIEHKWNNNSAVDPGDSKKLSIDTFNQSNAKLRNIKISIPINKDTIDISALRQNNVGIYKNNQFIISYKHDAELKMLDINDKKSIKLNLPIKKLINSGKNHTLKPKIRFSSQVEGVKNSKYNNEANTDPIKINSNLRLSSEVRYYTDDGDQLGRGPLPPQVGKPTKYWVFVNITNTSNNVERVSFSSTLPNYVSWTNKSSVSVGRDIKYNEKNRAISWFHNSLPPHSQASIYFRLELTPKEQHRNTTPVILRNIYLEGADSFSEENISTSFHPLNISLTEDQIGRNKGIKVQ